MNKIIFDKDKIKISRISIYDGSGCGVGFEQEGRKFFVHEAYGDIVKEYKTHKKNREPKTKLGKVIKAFRKFWSEE
jgi:hypothetical protein